MLYLPDVASWWAVASETLQSLVLLALRTVFASVPLLLLATAEARPRLPSSANSGLAALKRIARMRA